ncbi:hypothetical protein PSCFBP2116_P300065 (plasmid) [Pseudomonas syringae]|nr:hypothetical protein PSCFBP2116_P300065 [Pseudomonas syringae]
MNWAACGCKLWDFEIGYHSRNGVWGATEQKVHLSPVPVCKPACSLAGTIKPPFCETTAASTKEGNNTPKIGTINSFSEL